MNGNNLQATIDKYSTFHQFLTYISIFANLLYIRRHTRCSRLMIILLRLSEYISPQTENVHLTQMLQQDQIPQEQRWGTNFDDVCLRLEQGHYHISGHSSRFAQCSDHVQYVMK